MQNRLLRAGRCLREKKLDEAMSAGPNSIRILAVEFKDVSTEEPRAQEIAFPVQKSEMRRRKLLFLCGKSEMPRRRLLFLCGKSGMPRRKLLFL